MIAHISPRRIIVDYACVSNDNSSSTKLITTNACGSSCLCSTVAIWVTAGAPASNTKSLVSAVLPLLSAFCAAFVLLSFGHH